MKKDSIFPAAVLILSVLEALRNITVWLHWPGLVNAGIGIVGAFFFFTKNENYRKLLSLWIYVQFIVVTKTVLGEQQPVLDFTQFFHLKLGFSIGFADASYTLAFNFLPIVYIVTFKKLQIKQLIGTQLNLKLYRSNDVLNSVLPQAVTVIEQIDFLNNENWLLCKLSESIPYNDRLVEYCLIKSKDDVPIIPNKKAQMAHLRLVEDLGLMRVAPLSENQFIDWVFVE